MNEHLLYRAFTRDLEWILNTPSLLQGNEHLFSPDQLAHLDLTAIQPEPEVLLAARESKLGHYFEFLVKSLFEAHPDYAVLAENQIIHHGRTTLGELDLLLKHRQTGEILHLELALKFYLFVPGIENSAHAWVGAGLHDFLNTKLLRLWRHQLQLPHKARHRNCWPDELPMPDRSALWLPGRLYMPDSGSRQQWQQSRFDGTPWSINPQALTSLWFENDHIDLESVQALNKADWLNGRMTTTQDKPLPAQFSHPDYESPIYVLPFHWQQHAHHAIHNYQQTL